MEEAKNEIEREKPPEKDQTTALLQAVKAGPEAMLAKYQEQFSVTEPARKDYLTNIGNILDVKLTQGSSSAHLKDVLPGPYKILFATWRGTSVASFSPRDNTVNIGPENLYPTSNEFHLILLHEAGHAVDYLTLKLEQGFA